jgi:hypothetical protein
MKMPKILKCFDAAFVINADSQRGRLTKVTAEFQRIGISVERFAAITPTQPSGRLRPGEIGATLSHRAIVKCAKDRQYKNVLIFEDDVVFRPDFLSRWETIAFQVNDLNYDLFYFYDWLRPDQSSSIPTLTRITGTFCTHAYSVSAKYYDIYISAITNDVNNTSIDLILKKMAAEKWAVVPNLIGQDAGASTILGKHKSLRWSASDG